MAGWTACFGKSTFTWPWRQSSTQRTNHLQSSPRWLETSSYWQGKLNSFLMGSPRIIWNLIAMQLLPTERTDYRSYILTPKVVISRFFSTMSPTMHWMTWKQEMTPLKRRRNDVGTLHTWRAFKEFWTSTYWSRSCKEQPKKSGKSYLFLHDCMSLKIDLSWP